MIDGKIDGSFNVKIGQNKLQMFNNYKMIFERKLFLQFCELAKS